MKKLLLILLCLPLLFNSCRECQDCTLTFETEYDTNVLDSVVQNWENSYDNIPSLLDSSVNYLDWNEFTSLQYPELNQAERQCQKDFQEIGDWENEFWATDTMENLMYIGRFYYDCK